MEKKRSTDRPPTPGERAINWAKAGAIIIPLFGAGYFTNTDTVKRLYETSDENPPIVAETSESPKTCPEKVIERTIIKDCGASEAMISHIKALH